MHSLALRGHSYEHNTKPRPAATERSPPPNRRRLLIATELVIIKGPRAHVLRRRTGSCQNGEPRRSCATARSAERTSNVKGNGRRTEYPVPRRSLSLRVGGLNIVRRKERADPRARCRQSCPRFIVCRKGVANYRTDSLLVKSALMLTRRKDLWAPIVRGLSAGKLSASLQPFGQQPDLAQGYALRSH